MNNSQNKPQIDVPLSVFPQKAQADWSAGWWYPRHLEKINLSKQTEFEFVLLGDSITQEFESVGVTAWKNLHQHEQILNLGFSGDRTEHVLWRIQNGAFEFVDAKKIIILIGTNNTGHRFDSAEDTLKGIQAIVKELNKISPSSQIVIFGLLPREKKATHKFRIRNAEVNSLLSAWVESTEADFQNKVKYLDIGESFVAHATEISEDVMPDYLHLSEKGYEILVDALNNILISEK